VIYNPAYTYKFQLKTPMYVYNFYLGIYHIDLPTLYTMFNSLIISLFNVDPGKICFPKLMCSSNKPDGNTL
jgi:hypothetical protein